MHIYRGGSAATRLTVLQILSSQLKSYLRCPLRVSEADDFEQMLVVMGALGGTLIPSKPLVSESDGIEVIDHEQ